MNHVCIIAALDRELIPLVRNWQIRSFNFNGHRFRAYEDGPWVAMAGGIGPTAAAIATRAVVAQYHPGMLISAGVAGALQDRLTAGTVITPRIIIDSITGAEYRSDCGDGALVTTPEIADRKLKQALAARFHASAVDMEAAAVAAIARQEGIAFRCIKAISDAADFPMPPMNQFVDDHGQFRTLKFAAWAALRPSRWADVAALARQTSRASKALCEYLREMASRVPEAQPKTTQVLGT